MANWKGLAIHFGRGLKCTSPWRRWRRWRRWRYQGTLPAIIVEFVCTARPWQRCAALASTLGPRPCLSGRLLDLGDVGSDDGRGGSGRSDRRVGSSERPAGPHPRPRP